MICRPCRTKDHDHCADIHIERSDRKNCACQHRSGTFTTSTLNPDGTKTEGVYGATGARGSALTKPLTVEPELLEDVEVDPIAAIQAVYKRVMGESLFKSLRDQQHEYVEPAAPWGHKQTDKVWTETIESALKERRD